MIIQDIQVRNEIDKIKKQLSKIEQVKPLSKDATIEQIVNAINEITNSLKKR